MHPITESSFYGSLYDQQQPCTTNTTTTNSTANTTSTHDHATSCCDDDALYQTYNRFSIGDDDEEEDNTTCSLCNNHHSHNNRHEAKTVTTATDDEYYRMDKQTAKRMHAIRELLHTERDYVVDLGRLVEVFFEVLSRQEWIPHEHKLVIIRNAADILAFHRDFLVALENPRQHQLYDDVDDQEEEEEQHIANTFLDMGNDFHLYTEYCDFHDDAWQLCEEYRDRPEWAFFLKECMAAESATSSVATGSYLDPTAGLMTSSQSVVPTGNSKRLQFEDYLIKPVQRICRYQLLMREILRYTPPENPGFEALQQAMDRMQVIVTTIDQRKHERHIRERTDRFVQRLAVDNDWRMGRQHVARLGNLFIAGAIEVTYTALGQSVAKPRYLGCFIFSAYMILVRPKKVTSYEPKHWFPLRLAELEDLADVEGQREHAFVVRCKKHTFAFSATCHAEKQLWMRHLRNAIESSREQEHDVVDLIVPSLSGIPDGKGGASGVEGGGGSSQQEPTSGVRLSRSFTSMLDLKSPVAPIKRSVSTSIQLLEQTKTTDDDLTPLPRTTKLKKRHSADYPTRRKDEHPPMIKTRNHSESYITTGRKRPGSMDMLSSSSSSSSSPSMIGKIKSNHQNALRIAVDHKLHDVCTQDYLSTRFNLNDSMRKRKSMPSFIRSSASSFSIMSPTTTPMMYPHRRISEQSTTPSTTTTTTPSPPPQPLTTPRYDPDISSYFTASDPYPQRHPIPLPPLGHDDDDQDIYSATGGAGTIIAGEAKGTAMTEPPGSYGRARGSFHLGASSMYSAVEPPHRTLSTFTLHHKTNALVDRVFDKFKLTKSISTRRRRRSSQRQQENDYDDPSEDGRSYHHPMSETDTRLYDTLSDSASRKTHRSRKPSTIFRWIRSDDGHASTRQQRPPPPPPPPRQQQQPTAFAYASTPAQRPRWRRRFSTRNIADQCR
ncbi:hypothetical protein K492DRAFT_210721 [Lichtheimia hyalospora FSU 10163]|nr:hypothetical protein K492DRAFT_210721 [Lichtheimia hyalospora FSU 10163]